MSDLASNEASAPEAATSKVRQRRPRKDAEETRARIIAAAVRQLAQHGVGGMTLRGVLRDAGANHAAANYYFGSKAGLVTAVIEDYHRRKRQSMQALFTEALALPAGPARARKLVEAYIRPHVELVIGEGFHDYGLCALHFITAADYPDWQGGEKLIVKLRLQFRDALRDCCPEASSESISRAIGFVGNVMMQAPFDHAMHPLSRQILTDCNVDDVINESVEFAYGGLARLLKIKD